MKGVSGGTGDCEGTYIYSRSGAYTVGIAPQEGPYNFIGRSSNSRRNSNSNPRSKFLTVKILANFFWWIAIET